MPDKNDDRYKGELQIETAFLKDIIKTLSCLVDEAVFTITDKGMSIKCVDSAHVALITLEIPESKFEKFSMRPQKLGLDLDKLRESIQHSKSNFVTITRVWQEKNSDEIHIESGDIMHSFPETDPAGLSDPKVPNLQQDAKATINTQDFKRAIVQSQSVSDHITMRFHKEGIVIDAEGETHKCGLLIPLKEIENYKLAENKPVTSMYPLDYLSNIVSTCNESKMNVGTTNEFPIAMSWKMNGVDVFALLAPRVECPDE